MMKIISSIFACFLLFFAFEGNAKELPYKNSSLPIEQRVEDLLSRMTLEDKLVQIRHIHNWNILNGQDLDENKLKNFVQDKSWGFVEGFPLTGANCRKNMYKIQKYMVEQTRLGIPVFTVGESLHGSAHEGSVIFPQNIALGSTFNAGLAYRKAAMTTEDLHAQGMRQVLAPCIDVVRDLRWGRVEESYGEDPYLCGIFAMAEVQGYLDNGISPMLKHYGPHGNPLGGLNLASVECGVRDLHDIYLKPFEMVVTNQPVVAVMSTYNSWNRVPNSASRYLLTEVLRNQWGFDGYVYSDWGAIGMLQSFHHTAHNGAEAAIQAISAGLDVEASSDCYPELIALVKAGKFDEKIIDEAVRRVLKAKFKMGLFDDPYGEKFGKHEMHGKEAIELSRRIAEESAVLLKNDGNLLPLDVNELKSVAVIGPNAGQVQFGDYTWSRNNADGVTPLEGIKNLVGKKIQVNYAQGCSMMSLDTSKIAEAVKIAGESDVALIFCGSASASLARDYSSTNCGEGFDLSDLNLTGAQGELIKAVYRTGKPVVLVLVSGKPFSIKWEKQHIPAIIAQWYAGEQEGSAIADIIFGNINPSGRLTFSFPESVGQLPAYYNYLPSDRGFYKAPGSYEKPGRDYVFSGTAPLWSFGHGLSYTTFAYERMTVDRKEYNDKDTILVKVQLKNSGNREGKEVVQLYVRDRVSSLATPVKQLKAFDKVNLAPGEATTVTLKVPVTELYLTGDRGKRYLESGEFEIQVGCASDHILLKETVFVGDREKWTGEILKVAQQAQTYRAQGKEVNVKGVIRDIQATLVKDAEIFSSKKNKVVGHTDNKGEYKVCVQDDDVLTFGKKGYRSRTVAVNGQDHLNISMEYQND